MAAPKVHDMTWLQSGWEQNQGRSSHIRHYRPPAPCEKGASRNSLLQCNKMSVKAKQMDEKTRQIRFKYGKSNLERNFKKGVDLTPFVTKVQIKKTQESNSTKSAGSRVSARKSNESERVHFSIPIDEKQTINERTDGKALSSHVGNQTDGENKEENIEDESNLSEEVISVEMNLKTDDTNYLYPPQISEKDREDVQYVIKSLSRRFRDPIEASRRQIPPTRPIAAFARPTKGEIALSIKGPVLLAPISKVAKAKAQEQDKQSRIGDRSLPESAGSRNERACARPISSVSDSVVVTGKKMHGPGRAWSGCERALNGSLDQDFPLCHSCRGQRSSSSDTNITKERAKSAVYRDINRQRNSDGCLLQLRRQSSTKLHGWDAVKRDSNPKRRIRMRNGMISPHELQVNLDQLNSYDYGSPVPPPSLSNSDNEEILI